MKSISLICACKNRIDALRVSLNSWVKFKEITEIIVVDWNSDEPIDFITSFDPRIKVIKVPDEKYFNQPQPLNLASDIASGEYILKVDCDYIINPYYNFIESNFPNDGEFVCGEYEHIIDESDLPEDYNYFDLGVDNFRKYEKSYNPFYKYLIGLLFIKKEDLKSINGYNEILGTYYAFEDEEIFTRLQLSGLKKKRIDFDNTIIHIPHPDGKRFENFKHHVDNPEARQQVVWNLEADRERLGWSDEEIQWQTDYILMMHHVEQNKINMGEIKDPKVPRLNQWDLEQVDDRYFYAYRKNKAKNFEKLKNFPVVNYISLEESVDRQKNLEDQFKEYGVEIFSPLISKRFDQCNDIVTGQFVETLDSGTKGCVISHIKMIKKWYDTSNEKYGFFCEDDLSLESLQYWDFNWQEFVDRIPEDAGCVQLYCIRENQRDLKFENRWQTDWSVTAYIITKEYAKSVIDQYYINENEFDLTVFDTGWYPMPENVLFWNHGKTYAVNLFLEDLSLTTTFDGFSDGHKEYHLDSYDHNLNWWKTNSKNNLDLIFKEMEQNMNTEKLQPTKSIENDNRYHQIVLDIEDLLTEYASDTENAELNFKIGLWYEVHGQDAAALSYFLRSAERSEDDYLAYEALIHGAYCYDRQGTRDVTAKGIFQQALNVLPQRPEAYYHLAKFCRKRDFWTESHMYSNTALTFADFEDTTHFRTDVHFPGKFALLYEKSLSAWNWGKVQESYDLLVDIVENYEVPDEFKPQLEKEFEKFKKIEWFFTNEYKNILNNLSINQVQDLDDSQELSNDIGKMDIILQGGWDESTGDIIDSYLKLNFVNNIIVSTWKNENIDFDFGKYSVAVKDRIKFRMSEKPETPGTDNRNLQILSSQMGVEWVDTEYCAKMRTDQKYTDESMHKMYEYMCNNREFDDQIFVAGIYPNLLFHPRDHIFWGRTCDLKELFNVPLEYNGLADKIKVTKENLYKYYPFFVRSETYLGARYCSKFDETINVMILEPEKYLHDNCGGWNQAYNISQNVTCRAFKAFPREGIDFQWKKKGWDNYPYDDQKMGYGECWAEDFAQV